MTVRLRLEVKATLQGVSCRAYATYFPQYEHSLTQWQVEPSA